MHGGDFRHLVTGDIVPRADRTGDDGRVAGVSWTIPFTWSQSTETLSEGYHSCRRSSRPVQSWRRQGCTGRREVSTIKKTNGPVLTGAEGPTGHAEGRSPERVGLPRSVDGETKTSSLGEAPDGCPSRRRGRPVLHSSFTRGVCRGGPGTRANETFNETTCKAFPKLCY